MPAVRSSRSAWETDDSGVSMVSARSQTHSSPASSRACSNRARVGSPRSLNSSARRVASLGVDEAVLHGGDALGVDRLHRAGIEPDNISGHLHRCSDIAGRDGIWQAQGATMAPWSSPPTRRARATTTTSSTCPASPTRGSSRWSCWSALVAAGVTYWLDPPGHAGRPDDGRHRLRDRHAHPPPASRRDGPHRARQRREPGRRPASPGRSSSARTSSSGSWPPSSTTGASPSPPGPTPPWTGWARACPTSRCPGSPPTTRWPRYATPAAPKPTPCSSS